ncbi:hypothetical protein PROFUN_05545 [Planoprotostelium fungivorum]|uniref:Uncharacterized protein n=1 Tax=Planoprotostelium fungivorum TaxID=1890364 RepID=A0A2P6N041_9EUKA|nr:hypothetical protein PROFUN_05545 [Planoprotostelium fungivorum]
MDKYFLFTCCLRVLKQHYELPAKLVSVFVQGIGHMPDHFSCIFAQHGSTHKFVKSNQSQYHKYKTVALFVCPAFNSFSYTEFLNPLYGTILRPPPGMKVQHLPKGIRKYVTRNPADFKDYLDEISAETKYLSTISRLVKKEWSRCKEQNQEKNSAGCRELRGCYR